MIRIGLIGFGYWGPNLARNVAENSSCELVAICEQVPERRARAQHRYPTARVVAEPRELFAASDIDACIIATPVSTHAALALEALESGKHILVEKPLAPSTIDSHRIIELAEKKGLLVAVGHTFMYHPAVRKIQRDAAAGELGDILSFNSVRTNLGLFQGDYNVLWDLAVHDLSMLFHIVPQRPQAVSAAGLAHFPGHPEESAYLTLWLDKGCLAHIHVSWFSPLKIRQCIVGGSKKMVVYDDLNASEKVKIYDCGVTSKLSSSQRLKLEIDYRSGDMIAPCIENREPLSIELEDFVFSILERKKPISDGTFALRIVEVLEAADRSLRRQGMPIELR